MMAGTVRRSTMIRSHASQMSKSAPLFVPGIRRRLIETCTSHSQIGERCRWAPTNARLAPIARSHQVSNGVTAG